jgi:hypothetical protein
MESLEKLLQDEQEFTFDAIEHRIRCFPHIVNICVQHMIERYTSADFSNVPDSWIQGSNLVRKAEYLEALLRDPVECSRDTVRSVQSSGQRRKNFRTTIENGNANGSFADATNVVIKLPTQQLLRDMKTCWDSTYFMIKRVHVLRQVSQLI